jgi:hypothetical protein
MKSILRITTVFLFILLLNPVFAQNNRLKVAGSIQTDTILASKIIKPGGNSGQILMADGSVVTTGTGISISNGQISSTGGTANFTGNNTQFLMGDGSTVNTGNNLQVMAFDANRRPTYYNINTTAIGESVPEVATTSYVDFKLQENYGEYTNAIVSEATSTQLGRIKLTGDLGGTGNSPTVPGLALKFNLSDTADFANRFVRLRNAQTIAGNKTFTGTTNFTGNITLNGVAGTTGQVLSINASGNPAWVNLATSGGGGGITSLTSPLNITNGALSIPQASSTVNGFLSSGDWTRFNNKFNAADTTRLLNSRAKIFVPKIGGTDVSLVSGTSTDTLQIPLAGTNVAGGLLSNTTQNIAGNKTFFDNVAYRYQSAISFRDFNNTVDEWVFTRISGDPNLPGNTN